MKQILQNLKNGHSEIIDVPCPYAGRGQVLIRSRKSLVSPGTERILVQFGRAGWLEKARQQPDKVRMVLDKIKTDGVWPTLEAIRHKLDQPLPMGYSNLGVVQAIGEGVEGFKVGDRVASNGYHAESVLVPMNLCAKVPDDVSDDEAVFTVLGAIALQGVRLTQPTLGEAYVVIGLGLIGLLTVQLLRAHGCRVLGAELDQTRLDLARQFGTETVDLGRGEDPQAAAQAFSKGRGVDAVIIAASTRSHEPLIQAARMCRKRGRIVLVGVVGLELSRTEFYEKELSFQVSCSYGPGRYDPAYEEKGGDYPFGFVRWTAQRNFEAVLDMMAERRLDVKPLITHQFRIDEANKAYELIASGSPSLGVLLEYPSPEQQPDELLFKRTIPLGPSDQFTVSRIARDPTGQKPVIGVIGAGNYATSTLIPAFKQTGAWFRSIASNGGVSGYYVGRKFGFEQTTTDADTIFDDPAINTVVIATRHDSHASLVCRALAARKHVFVEKPLCLTLEELEEIEGALSETDSCPRPKVCQGGPKPEACQDRLRRNDGEKIKNGGNLILMVGFNRRFAPQVQKIKALLEEVKEPKSFIMTVNAGAIPSNHWTQDPEVGGGRIIGEACHFVDLLRFLAASPIISTQPTFMRRGSKGDRISDRVTFTIQFADGSFGTVHYLANGHKSFPKERLEVFCGGRILELDNFTKLKGYGWPGFRRMTLWRQNKGQQACAATFLNVIRNGEPSPILFEEILEVSRVTLELGRQAK